MILNQGSRRKLTVEVEHFRLRQPFHIANHSISFIELVVVSIEENGCLGRGEATGMFYRQDDDASAMMMQIEGVRPEVEGGLDRHGLQDLLPPSGARNAIDCALWDLEAKLARRAVWDLAGLEKPRTLVTTFTIGASDPDKMYSDALAYGDAKAIKVKLTGNAADSERVRAIRRAQPDAWLAVDCNQGFSPDFLNELMPVFIEARVRLIEQPFRVGEEGRLQGLCPPIPIAADESAMDINDLSPLVGRFQCVNIKLDKCGGLTAGLAMLREARRLGLDAMVGNTIGTSLSMAPAFLVGQLCSIVDLDGPVLLSEDRRPGVRYDAGMIWCPDEVWGAPSLEILS